MNQPDWEQTSLLPPTASEQKAASRRCRSFDPDWEALIRETNANPGAERIVINMALKVIRTTCAHDGIADVAAEISVRAAAYRKSWPSLTLTPMALAKHWYRVAAERTTQTVEEQALAALRHPQHGKMTL